MPPILHFCQTAIRLAAKNGAPQKHLFLAVAAQLFFKVAHCQIDLLFAPELPLLKEWGAFGDFEGGEFAMFFKVFLAKAGGADCIFGNGFIVANIVQQNALHGVTREHFLKKIKNIIAGFGVSNTQKAGHRFGIIHI